MKPKRKLVIWITMTVLMLSSMAGCGPRKSAQPAPEPRVHPYRVDGTQPHLTINEAAVPRWRKTADAIISDGMKYMGTPYVYGAERFNDKTFDCSSYVQYLYAKQGIKLGYNAREQAVEGEEIPFMNMRRGDLMFFSDEDYPNETGLNKVRHVGIYMGDGKILHTYEPGIGVVISNIHKDEKEGEYWYQNYLFARRVIPG
ncbi:C40 family peptidase [Brevibacillus ruminantium]|uniref:C40 family peptidase n=1 Tax=Brevibacillus ruminantium TaxID=2950604 RepID=A0ABY4WLH8_9BACL|nr:C40 family peptidase [Brevibacillus ruminantium]USG66229.1 C40 family peptidase [Brevibacillus ruminantium]